MTAYIGARLAAFTFGPGRSKRTPAISAVIAIAAARDMLPAAPRPFEEHVDRRLIALFQLAVASGDLPMNHHYLLSGYEEAGTAKVPIGSEQFPPASAHELSLLRQAGVRIEAGEQISREVMLALMRLRVEACFPDASALLIPYPVPSARSGESLAEAQRTTSQRLRSLPPQPRPDSPLDIHESQRYMAALEKRWQLREVERQHGVPKKQAQDD